MARYHYWQYIVDEEGTPLDGVEISFKLSGTETFASIFLNPTTGAITTTENAQLTTDENGFFEFWVGDKWEAEGGYDYTQKFRLQWYKAGIIAGEIDPVDIFPPLQSVDETGTGQALGEKEKKNKLISNALAYKWNSHIDLPVPSASPHDLHPVEICDTDNQFNKVVSNRLITEIYQAAISGGNVSLDASTAKMVSYYVNASDLVLSSGVPSAGTFILTNPPSANNMIKHNLFNEWPVVQVMKMPKKEVITPNVIKSISNRRTVIEVAVSADYRVTIIG